MKWRNNMKKLYLTLALAIICSACLAQEKFNAKNFETELETYVVNEAKLTVEEAKNFLPIYRELRKKQVAAIEADRKVRSKAPANDAEWAEQLQKHDESEIAQKKLLQTYHNKMLKVMSAKKVMRVIKAEENFFRGRLKEMHQGGPNAGGPAPAQKK